MASRTSAAAQFIDSARVAWDSRGPWEETARLGLAEPDAEALEYLCRKTGEDYATAEAQVLAAIREKVANLPRLPFWRI